MRSLQVSQNLALDKDVGIIKKYNDNAFKLIHIRSLKLLGFERAGSKLHIPKGCAGNNQKLQNSLSRTQRTIYDLAMCNDWEYFITLTIAPDKFDRYNLDQFIKSLGKWLNNYNSRKNTNIKYLLVPEPHKDGAWHLHGLMMGLPIEHLILFTLNDTLPYKVRELIEKGRLIYNWPAYAEKFGYVTAEAVLDQENCAGYMTKYITKDLMESKIALNHHCYYASQHLKRPETIHRGHINTPFEPDFQNDFIALKWLKNAEEALIYFE